MSACATEILPTEDIYAYLSKDVFILSKQQYSSPVVALHDRLKCWEQQYQCQTISKVTFEAISIKQCG